MVTIIACLPAESPSMLIIEPYSPTSPGLILFTRMCSMPCGSDGMFRRFKMWPQLVLWLVQPRYSMQEFQELTRTPPNPK